MRCHFLCSLIPPSARHQVGYQKLVVGETDVVLSAGAGQLSLVSMQGQGKKLCKGEGLASEHQPCAEQLCDLG